MRPETEDDADDAALRKQFAEVLPRTSDAHDAAILAAADLAARDIRARRRHRWLVPASLAASLVLVGLFALLRPPGELPDSLRGDPATLVVSPASGATLSRLPSELLWPVVDGATSYSVELRDATGAILGTHDAGASNQALLSSFATASFHPGTYFWTVRARGPALDRQLGPFTFALEQVP